MRRHQGGAISFQSWGYNLTNDELLVSFTTSCAVHHTSLPLMKHRNPDAEVLYRFGVSGVVPLWEILVCAVVYSTQMFILEASVGPPVVVLIECGIFVVGCVCVYFCCWVVPNFARCGAE